jgi:YHS domain-containing protein
MNFDTLKSLLWWLGIGLLFIWMMRRGGCFGMMMRGRDSSTTSEGDGPYFRSPAGKPVDPVCGMEVEPAKAVATRLSGSETLFFCSDRCLEAFDKNPSAYTERASGHSQHQHSHAGCC